MNSKAEGLCLCTNRDTQVLFPEKVKFWEFRELMQSVWPTPIKLLGQTKLSFSCVKFGSHSVGFHSRIIEKKLVLAFMAAFCHLPFHAIKH